MTEQSVATSSDLALLADQVREVRHALPTAEHRATREQLSLIESAMEAHRCAPAVEVATPAGEGWKRGPGYWIRNTPAASTAEGEGEEPIYTVDQAWFRQVLAAAHITSCVSVSPDDVVMHFAGMEKRRVETEREADSICRNLTRVHKVGAALKAVVTEMAEQVGVTVGPLHTPQQIEVVGQQLAAALRDATPAVETP